MFLLLLALALGVADAGNRFFEIQQEETLIEDGVAVLSSEMTEAAERLPANFVDESDEEAMMLGPLDVVWCDRRHYCRNGQTCCKHRHWKWGCCVYKCGICCKDGKTCCPSGKRCSSCGRHCY